MKLAKLSTDPCMVEKKLKTTNIHLSMFGFINDLTSSS
jgi:hypothetical protein